MFDLILFKVVVIFFDDYLFFLEGYVCIVFFYFVKNCFCNFIIKFLISLCWKKLDVICLFKFLSYYFLYR